VREHYLSHQNFEFPKLITKFRICDHTIEIVLGRYKKNHPEILQLVIFAKITILIMTFISFFFPCERNCIIRKKNEFNIEKEATRLSEIEKKIG